LGDVFVAKFGDAPQTGPNVTIAATASAASYDGSAISPGEIVVITGTALGPAQLISASPSGGLFPTTLSQTRVLIGGKAAPLLYASERQTSAIVPWDVIGPNAEIVVEYQGVRSRALTLPVVASLPGLFSANASGRGQAAALNQDFSLNSASTPADPGSIVVLYGTGEGSTLPVSVDGKVAEAPLPRPELPVNVTVGLRPATPSSTLTSVTTIPGFEATSWGSVWAPRMDTSNGSSPSGKWQVLHRLSRSRANCGDKPVRVRSKVPRSD
jgi:uncharacterized protein (TIGR03437 family)